MDGLNTLELFYLFCALFGGTLVVARMVMQFMGAGDGDTGMDGGDSSDLSGHADSDAGFKLLSLHGLSAFMLMFGLVGFVVYRQEQAGSLISLAAALFGGYISFYVIKKIFDGMVRMQSSGTLAVSTAVGSEGEVYLNIPKDGTGRVLVDFHGRLREFDAMAENGQEMKTGEKIKVVRMSGNILVVEHRA
ncbi:MAG: hypothetical protein JEZ02_07205 [Desulfatibacillum sp.]|nr:hypothetical protein [Desulfatibacillum sp.]